MRESGENYLETILLLSKRLPCVRAVDVASELGYSKPSVSRAMGILADSGLVIYDRRGIRLTEAGLLAASAVYERHKVIARFLQVALGLPDDTAEADACRIEHIISDEAFARMREYIAQENK